MARKPRLQVPGGIYHVTTGATGGAHFFVLDTDRRWLLSSFDAICTVREWRCIAYCLMGTHFHLLLQTKQPDLAAGMKALNAGYAQSFNRRHSRRGHFVADRYWSELVLSDRHLRESIRYVALNPVRAGLVTKPEQWPWSSYAQIVRGRPAPPVDRDYLLGLFGGGQSLALDRLTRFVNDLSAL
jgi:REP element-mobilizing transposase RayT